MLPNHPPTRIKAQANGDGWQKSLTLILQKPLGANKALAQSFCVQCYKLMRPQLRAKIELQILHICAILTFLMCLCRPAYMQVSFITLSTGYSSCPGDFLARKLPSMLICFFKAQSNYCVARTRIQKTDWILSAILPLLKCLFLSILKCISRKGPNANCTDDLIVQEKINNYSSTFSMNDFDLAKVNL